MSIIARWLRVFGADPKRTLAALRGMGRFLRDRREYRRRCDGEFRWAPAWPVLDEWHDAAGSLGAYFHQDHLVARWIYQAHPVRHVDVGSRIDGFLGHLAVFREVDVLDLRAAPGVVPNVRFHQVDLMAALPAEWVECTDSLSCLHTIEHFGLGRYGDAIDPAGYRKGWQQLGRIVRPGGVIYLSTPIGPQRIEFNAHRIFSLPTVLGWFADGWEIQRLAIVDDAGHLREEVDWRDREADSNFGCQTGLAIVMARKKPLMESALS